MVKWWIELEAGERKLVDAQKFELGTSGLLEFILSGDVVAAFPPDRVVSITQAEEQ